MWKLDHKKVWIQKNWFFWNVVLGKTLERCLNCKDIKPVNTKRNQSWIFTGVADAEAEVPILRPPDVKSWLIGKGHHPGKSWRWEEKGMTEDEMVGWHHGINGHECEQAPGDGEWQGSLACCSSKSQTACWSSKESDMTEWLTRNNSVMIAHILSIKIVFSAANLFPSPPRLFQWLSSKESACNAEDIEVMGSIPGLGRSPRGGNGNFLKLLMTQKNEML